MKTKKKAFNIIYNIHSIDFLTSPFVWGTDPRIRFLGQHRIRTPDDRAKNQIYLKAHIGNKHTDRKPGVEGTARNDKKYICDKCTFKTGYRPKLDEHIQNIHGINELYCEQCDFSTMLPKVE